MIGRRSWWNRFILTNHFCIIINKKWSKFGFSECSCVREVCLKFFILVTITTSFWEWDYLISHTKCLFFRTLWFENEGLRFSVWVQSTGIWFAQVFFSSHETDKAIAGRLSIAQSAKVRICCFFLLSVENTLFVITKLAVCSFISFKYSVEHVYCFFLVLYI